MRRAHCSGSAHQSWAAQLPLACQHSQGATPPVVHCHGASIDDICALYLPRPLPYPCPHWLLHCPNANTCMHVGGGGAMQCRDSRTLTAAHTAAPLLMPQNRPSSVARRAAIAIASSLDTCACVCVCGMCGVCGNVVSCCCGVGEGGRGRDIGRRPSTLCYTQRVTPSNTGTSTFK